MADTGLPTSTLCRGRVVTSIVNMRHFGYSDDEIVDFLSERWGQHNRENLTACLAIADAAAEAARRVNAGFPLDAARPPKYPQ